MKRAPIHNIMKSMVVESWYWWPPTNVWVELEKLVGVVIVKVVIGVGLCKGPNTQHVVGIGCFEKGPNTKNSIKNW